MPFNPNKPGEHGFKSGVSPQPGATVEPASRLPTASTLSEAQTSDKTGTVATEGVNRTIESLDRVRVDSSGQVLTTNQGVAIECPAVGGAIKAWLVGDVVHGGWRS